jgi:ATP-binding cassette subfamily F protein 3
VLSGGERTRLALAKLLVSPVNFLCMDEPTNHLDMWSRDVLEEALGEFSGTIVLITHDRHLIRSVANRVIEVIEGRVTNFDGDYAYYLAKSERAEVDSRPTPARSDGRPRETGPKTKEQKRLEAEARQQTKTLRDRVTRIERELDELTTELKVFEEAFADPDLYMSGADVAEMTKRYEAAKRRHKKLESNWAEAMQNLEAAESV